MRRIGLILAVVVVGSLIAVAVAIASGRPDDVRAHPAVQAAYLDVMAPER